jgi:phosphatidylserine/phosphatidylglycerophosphate/cardiolipin synthase-like enzyme
MAEFLTTKGIVYRIEQIIKNSKSKLIIVSPYLKISKDLTERLLSASKRGVEIKIIYGKDELNTEAQNTLSTLKNLELYYYDNLHAKCYFNENEMVIASMNLYEFSEQNREMGIRITRKDDYEVYDKAFNEARAIKEAGQKQNIKKYNKKKAKKKKHEGFCIRCGDEITLDIEKPLCRDCFEEWSIYENIDYPEKYCHICGKKEKTTMKKPTCWPCYKKN